MNSVAVSVLAAFALCVVAVTLAVLLVPSTHGQRYSNT